jgi:hypothetical protein
MMIRAAFSAQGKSTASAHSGIAVRHVGRIFSIFAGESALRGALGAQTYS